MTPPKPPITTSPKLASTHSPRSPGPASRNSFARPCLWEVHQSSASGALKLLQSRHGPVLDQVLGDAGGGGPGLAEQREHAVGWVPFWGLVPVSPGPWSHVANLYVVLEICEFGDFPSSSVGKESACNAKNLGSLPESEKEMATHSSILAYRIPQTEDPGGPLYIGLQESDMT